MKLFNYANLVVSESILDLYMFESNSFFKYGINANSSSMNNIVTSSNIDNQYYYTKIGSSISDISKGLINPITNQDHAITFWFRNNNILSNSYYLIGNNTNFNIKLNQSGSIEFYKHSDESYSYIVTNSNYCDNNWHNLIINVNDLNVNAYIDNTLYENILTLSEYNTESYYGVGYIVNNTSSFINTNTINFKNICVTNKLLNASESLELFNYNIFSLNTWSMHSVYTFSNKQALKSNILNTYGYSKYYYSTTSINISGIYGEYLFTNGNMQDNISKSYSVPNNNITKNYLDRFNRPNACYIGSYAGTHYFNPTINTNISNSFSISFWAKPATSINMGLSEANTGTTMYNIQYCDCFICGVWKAAATAACSMGIVLGSNGLYVYEHADSHMPPVLKYSGTISGNIWNHIVILCNNKAYSMYLNNTLVRTGKTSTKTYVFPGEFISRLNSDWRSYIGGYDDIRYYNKVLSAGEISQLYNETDNGYDIIYPKYPLTNFLDVQNNQLEFSGSINFPISLKNFIGTASNYLTQSYIININDFSHIDFNPLNITEKRLSVINKNSYVGNTNYYPEIYDFSKLMNTYNILFDTSAANITNSIWISNSFTIDNLIWLSHNKTLEGLIYFQEYFSNSILTNISDFVEFNSKIAKTNLIDIANYYNNETKLKLIDIYYNTYSYYNTESLDNLSLVQCSYTINTI